MFAAAFIQSISFLLFACSARLLLPEASLSLTRRTVRSRLARSFTASTTSRLQSACRTCTHHHLASHRRVHNVLCHRTFHRSHGLISWSVADSLFEKTVKLRDSHVVPVFHFSDGIFKFLFELFGFHLTLSFLLISLIN